MKTLQDLIQKNVVLAHQTNTGFWPVACKACNDHSPRAGFKFDNKTVGYHCFNCKRKFTYVEGETDISNTAIYILGTFGISKSSILEVVNGNFFETGEITFERIIQARQKNVNSIIGTEVKLPKNTFYVGSEKFPDIEGKIVKYLEGRRIDPYKVKAMYSLSERHTDRVILPIYQNGKLIHWQSRTMLSDVRPRYLTCYENKNLAIWGLHNLYNHEGPLFITEGIFDAALIDGVAILGSDLSEEKLKILDNCRRKKVIVVDADDNGNKLAHAAVKHGWMVTNCVDKLDVNKSVIKHGILFTIHTLMSNICAPEQTGVEFGGMDLSVALELGFKNM
jgi:hypothetical protein